MILRMRGKVTMLGWEDWEGGGAVTFGCGRMRRMWSNAQRSGRSVRCTREFESHRCHDSCRAAWPSGLRRYVEWSKALCCGYTFVLFLYFVYVLCFCILYSTSYTPRGFCLVIFLWKFLAFYVCVRIFQTTLSVFLVCCFYHCQVIKPSRWTPNPWQHLALFQFARVYISCNRYLHWQTACSLPLIVFVSNSWPAQKTFWKMQMQIQWHHKCWAIAVSSAFITDKQT